MHLDSAIVISSSFQRITICPFELTTYNQFYVLALYVRMVLFLPRGELVECPGSQNLVHLVLRVRMAVRELRVGHKNQREVEFRIEVEDLPQR